MKKISKRELKSYITLNIAKDVTNEKIVPDCYEKIAYTSGVYGISGCLYSDKEGNLYAITNRSSNLFRIF